MKSLLLVSLLLMYMSCTNNAKVEQGNIIFGNAIEMEGLSSGSELAQRAQRELAKSLPLEIRLKEIGLTMRLIPAGKFMMGSPEIEIGRQKDETQHEVTLTKPFWLGKYEVTQKEWQAIMGSNPSGFKGENLPVETVSWDDCQEFVKKLNEKFKDSLPKGYVLDLPTEAQWEYACRAGTNTPWYFGNSLTKKQAHIGDYYFNGKEFVGDRSGNSGPTVKGGAYAPNAFGLYDMHGNVWEWCRDYDGELTTTAVTDPLGPVNGSDCVFRGGSFNSDARSCRSASRSRNSPDFRFLILGFRLVLRCQ